ncbi:MAG: hypothetical protein ACI8XO_000290, partial [Verrucomicrobiales bacterium]
YGNYTYYANIIMKIIKNSLKSLISFYKTFDELSSAPLLSWL